MTKRLLLCMIVLLLAQAVWAKGPPQKITISGEGLAGEIVITDDETTLNALAMMTLEDYVTFTADAPDGISGEGYLLTRFYEISPDRYVPFDQVRYFRSPNGGRGYIQYVGIVNGSSEYDGKWFRPTQDGEIVLQAVLARQELAQDMVRDAVVWRAFLNIAEMFAP